MQKPEEKILSYFNFSDLRKYLNYHVKGLGTKFEEVLAEGKHDDFTNDKYVRYYIDTSNEVDAMVAKMMGWENGRKVVLWVSW